MAKLEGAFHKVVANCGGLYVEVELDADPRYQATGIIRVHRRDHASLPDAVTHRAAYGASGDRPSQNLALGPEWKNNGAWRRLGTYRG
ncbi:MAG: hypothetical protein HY238_06100 [Acidobacteria bacterium]|nr:hypothetical protein [Acidobacteriota bacterium]